MKNKFKWLISTLLVFVLLAGFATTAYAAGDSVATATNISTGVQYSGSITNYNPKDVYKFTIASSGRININLKANIYVTHYCIYDANGEEIWGSSYRRWNDVTEMMSMDENIDLIKGTYYFAIAQEDGTGNYNFKINFTSAKESFSETSTHKNNDFASADKIVIDKTYKGQIAQNDNKDFYKFELQKNTTLKIKATANICETNYYLYDENGNSVWSKIYVYWNDTTQKSTINETIYLSAGTYYFAVEQYYGTGNYSFYINHTHITKPKTAVKATLAKNGKTNYVCSYCGKVVSSKTVYTPKKFSLSTTQYSYNGKVKTPSVTVKDSKGNTLKKNTDYTVKYSSGRKSIGKYCVTVTFKGKYSGTKKLYFTIGPKATSKITATQSTSAITLKWNKVSGAKGYRVYKYNTKTKKYDKLKDVTGTSLKISKLKAGTVYKYRVQAYAKKSGTTLWGAKSSVFTTATKPATPKITKLTSKYSGSAYIKWSNVSGENGYEVYYSTSKNKGYTYAGYTSANNVSGTKYYLTSRKTYYFKVRSYKIVSGKYIYSAWSTPKGVKVK